MVRTFENVASVCQKILTTLYDTYFPAAEARRPGLLVNVQTATFFCRKGLASVDDGATES